jgi:WD40 repeat protein
LRRKGGKILSGQELSGGRRFFRRLAAEQSFNPYSPYRDPDLAVLATPEAANKVATSSSWLFQADVHRLLSFEAELVGHSDNVTGVAYSADGHWLATAGSDHSVKLWDARVHRLIKSFAGHTDSVRDVGFTPDGRTLVSCDRAGIVRVWNVAEGREETNWEGHEGEIRGLAVSLDGTRVATASRDKMVKIWRLPDGRRKPHSSVMPVLWKTWRFGRRRAAGLGRTG